MEADDTRESGPTEIPEDAVIVKQSYWAWLWYVVPWAGLIGASFYFDQLTFGAMPLVIGLLFVVPQFMRWRGTAYILTNEQIIVKRGSSRLYDLPFSEIGEVRSNPGFFGASLGYTSVYLVLKDGRSAFLPHVPVSSPLMSHVLSRVDTPPPPPAPNEENPDA